MKVTAATVVLDDGEVVTGLRIGDQCFWWQHGDPQLGTVAAVMHETASTTVLHQMRRLALWLADRNPLMWPQFFDVLFALGDALDPVGAGPAWRPGAPSAPRPAGAINAGWFCE